MKMLKLKTLASIIILIPFLYACPKAKNAVAPVADTDVQSSADVVLATFLVSDIEMVCSFIGENDYSPDFYVAQPGEDPAKFQAFNPTGYDHYVASFNNMKCMDGHTRAGSIFMNYSNTNPNSKYYPNYEFHGRITLSDYRVDGWLIRTVNGVPCDVINQLKSPVFDPKQTNLEWTIKGSFEMIHPTDPSKNMVWTGELTKILKNTSNPTVYNASRLSPIDWTKAEVAYKGTAKGVTSGNVPFELAINEYFPLVRDFTCYPNQVGGIETVQPLKTWKNESHPFISGKVNFTTDSKYPREIYLGNEELPGTMAPCDNSGTVLIKGNTYPVNFY